MHRLRTAVPLLRSSRSLHASLQCRALEDPLKFPVSPAQVDKAFTQLVSGQGSYLLKGGLSKEYALAARDRILELVRLENSRATHFTSLPICGCMI